VDAALPGFERARREFPTVDFAMEEIAKIPSLSLIAGDWESPRFPFYELDARLDDLADSAAGGPWGLDLAADPGRLAGMALEVLTRCQRRVGRRNASSSTPLFDRVLERHRSLHDISKPLVRADWAHSMDVWQWTIRLDPDAGLAVQLAALFHDVERLVSEADVRIEHRADDYQSFKDEHARRGAELADEALAAAGVDSETRARTARLIAGHEHLPAPDDPDSADFALLNDADALSFFSLNSPGYADYFGPEAARRKVAWTLARLRPAARERLGTVRLRPDVAEMVR
jgi:predicted metal-dependent HD superfamily phosphohydrolase